MPNRVFTIGRSTHFIDEFMKALRNCGDLEFGPTRLSGYEMKLRISPFVQERPNNGQSSAEMPISFFGPDRAVVTDGPNRDQTIEFVRDASGRVNWVRVVGRVAVRTP